MKNRKKAAVWIKTALGGTAVCGVLLNLGVFPIVGSEFVRRNPLYAHAYWPWILFLWLTAVPAFAGTCFSWRAADAIGRGTFFTESCAALLRKISAVWTVSTALILVGNIILFAVRMSHLCVLVFFLVFCFADMAAAIFFGWLASVAARGAVNE